MNKNEVKEVLWNLAKERGTDEFIQVAMFAMEIAEDMWASHLSDYDYGVCKPLFYLFSDARKLLVERKDWERVRLLQNKCQALSIPDGRYNIARIVIANAATIILSLKTSQPIGGPIPTSDAEIKFDTLWDDVIAVACGYESYGQRWPGVGYDLEAGLISFCKSK